MANDKARILITYEEAVEVLPNKEFIHTFLNGGFGLVGADWSRSEILDKLKNSEVIELTGKTARSMGHGICAYNKDTQNALFIETDETKLSKFDKRTDKTENIKIIIHIEADPDTEIIGIKEDFAAYCEKFGDVKRIDVESE